MTAGETAGAASGANPLRRAFVAVVPPASVLDALEQFVRSAPVSPGPGVRWSPRAQWHLTLRFLGPVAAAEPLGAALREALAREAPGTTALGGAGAFPSIAKASVVWIGVREGVDTLARLAAVVDRVVVGCGFVAESRPFRPHLTVGRLRSPGPVRGLVGALGPSAVGPSWTVEEAVLVESDTRADGAVHRVVQSFPLAS